MRHALFLLSLAFSASVFSQTAPNALSGVVSSAEEGAMEGVLVSAKKAGSTITVTVVSDKQGHYSFPASKLEPGKYSLKVRAVGFDIDDVSVSPNPLDRLAFGNDERSRAMTSGGVGAPP